MFQPPYSTIHQRRLRPLGNPPHTYKVFHMLPCCLGILQYHLRRKRAFEIHLKITNQKYMRRQSPGTGTIDCHILSLTNGSRKQQRWYTQHNKAGKKAKSMVTKKYYQLVSETNNFYLFSILKKVKAVTHWLFQSCLECIFRY